MAKISRVCISVCVLLAYLVFIPTLLVAAGDEPCTHNEFHEAIEIRHVVDGDTIRLTDNRLIRLIGINTPEIDYEGENSQPVAWQARAALKQLFAKDSRAFIRHGLQKKDKYARTLAHVYLRDGTNIQQSLLRQGLGFWIAIPPNLQHQRCYQQAEIMAKQDNLGVWDDAYFRPKRADDWRHFDPGFQFVAGDISRIEQSRKSIRLYFNKNAVLHIYRDDLKYFNVSELADLKGNSVVARGWWYKKKGQWRVNIKHPSAIQRL